MNAPAPGSPLAQRHDVLPTLGVVLLAASAGGIAALEVVLGALPADLGLAVVLLQHLDPHRPSALAHLLARRTRLWVEEASDGSKLRAGKVLVCPPGRHTTISEGGSIKLDDRPPVHFVRPSADLLFESAARTCAERTIAVVLTGTGSDGARGALALHRAGGFVIAQDPATAQFPKMPAATIATGAFDLVLDLAAIGPRLVTLARPPFRSAVR